MLCDSENFEGLSEGLQNALWELGAIPARHRTDSLSSAVNNMSNLEEFTDRYKSFLNYYGLEPERIQVRKANENGDIEQRHHRLKRAVEQALFQRGNRDFARIETTRSF